MRFACVVVWVPLASRPDLRPRNEDDAKAQKDYVAAHENETVREGIGMRQRIEAEECNLHRVLGQARGRAR